MLEFNAPNKTRAEVTSDVWLWLQLMQVGDTLQLTIQCDGTFNVESSKPFPKITPESEAIKSFLIDNG